MGVAMSIIQQTSYILLNGTFDLVCVSTLGHSKLIFSFWSSARICFFMMQFMRTTQLLREF